MLILSGPDTGSHRLPRRHDHVTCHNLPYVVLDIDIEGLVAKLALGDDADHYSALGRITAPVAELLWRV